MFKFITQLFISATVGVAVAAGADANIRGYIGEALREPDVYVQESASAIANTFAHFSADSEEANAAAASEVNVIANENGSANGESENTADVSAQSTTDIQVDSNLNVESVLPDFLGLEAGAALETQTQTESSVNSEDEYEDEYTELSLWQQLGLSLGFGVDAEDK